MDEKRKVVTHGLVMNNREELKLSGIMDVLSFDEELVVVETDMGMLEIKGSELHINQLDLEQGDLNLTGLVEAIEYIEHKTFNKAKESFITKLFS